MNAAEPSPQSTAKSTPPAESAATSAAASSAAASSAPTPAAKPPIDQPSDDQTTLAELKQWVADFCTARDWDQFHNPKDLAIGVITEAAELLEIMRFQNDAQQLDLLHNPDSRAAIAAELADVLMFLLRFAQRFDFDLAVAVRDKLIQNGLKYPLEASRGKNNKYNRPS